MKIWVRLVVLACAALVPVMQARLDERLGAFRSQEEVLYVWSGEHLRRMLPGLEAAMADIYWLRTVQYFGGQRAFATDKDYSLLEPLSNITVTLDPHFEIAYRYGATFLAEPFPTGAGRADAAVALLQRGVDQNPDAWYLWQHLGLFKFQFQKDAQGAAETLLAASRRPGAPVWMEPLAALVWRKQGNRAEARAIWRSVLEHSEDGPMKENARAHLDRFDAADAADALTRVAERFRAERGRYPTGWQELVAVGLLRRQPIDATGVPLDYDATHGVFSISGRSVLYIVR